MGARLSREFLKKIGDSKYQNNATSQLVHITILRNAKTLILALIGKALDNFPTVPGDKQNDW